MNSESIQDLPCTERVPSRHTTSTQAETRNVARERETLLVVEDEADVRHLAVAILEGEGYKVLRAPDGQEALRVVREHAGEPIRLVVSDIIMPRMGGNVMAEWLHTILPDLKVLFTSGYSDDLIAQQGKLNGGVSYLPKPYTSATLKRKVREVLDSSEKGRKT